jgi:hypothetical protein
MKCVGEVRGNPSIIHRNLRNTVNMNCDYGLNRILAQEMARTKGKSAVLLANTVELRALGPVAENDLMRGFQSSMNDENGDVTKKRRQKAKISQRENDDS